MQTRLLSAEERHPNSEYVWVRRLDTFQPVHVTEMAPASLPSFDNWLEACRELKRRAPRAAFDRVIALRRAVDAERRQLGFDPESLQFTPRLLMAVMVSLHQSCGETIVPALLKDLYDFREAELGGDWPDENGTVTESAVAARVCASADEVARSVEQVWRRRTVECWLGLLLL